MADLDSFGPYISIRVPWQSAVEAIGNTIKHAEYRDSGWPKGIAMPASFVPEHLKSERDACNDGLELFSLLHKHRDVAWWDIALRQHPSDDATPGYVAFGDVLENWESLLKELGYQRD